MFKSKYGLVSALIVIAATAAAYFMVTSRIDGGVRNAAIEKLTNGDRIARQVEESNRAQSIALAYRAAAVVRPHVARIWDLRAKLAQAVMEELPLFARDAKVPVFIAVVKQQAGETKNDIVYWAAVNGTDLAETINTEWVTAEEWEKLVKNTKPTPVNPAPAPAAVPAAPAAATAAPGAPATAPAAGAVVEVPVLFPGEAPGKFVIKPAPAAKYVSATAKTAFAVDIAFMSEKSEAPLTMGALVVAFDSADIRPEAVEPIIMRIARKEMVRAFVPAYELERANLHEILTAMSVGIQKKDAPAPAAPAQDAGMAPEPAKGDPVPDGADAVSEYELGGLKPYFVLLNFSNGAVITRDKDDSKTIGYNHLKYSGDVLAFMTQAARTGQAAYDIVEHEAINRFPLVDKPAKLYQAATVPVMEGKRGAFLTMLWPFEMRVQQLKGAMNLDVAFFYGNQVYFPTFSGANTVKKASSAEETLRGRLGDAVESPLAKNPKAVLQPKSFEFAQESFLGVFHRAGLTLNGKAYGYALFASVDEIERPYANIGMIVLLFGLLMLILVIVMENLVFVYFYDSIDAINEGIQEVTSGNLDFTFGRVSRETEGLSNSLNGLLDILLARESAQGEDEDELPSKRGIQFLVLGRMPENPYSEKDSAVSPLVGLGEDAYYNQLYQKFMMAWPKLGQEDPAPRRELFLLRVTLFERLVRERFDCERVFFDLEFADGSIVLVPLPVADE